jgi:hypothetical protein
MNRMNNATAKIYITYLKDLMYVYRSRIPVKKNVYIKTSIMNIGLASVSMMGISTTMAIKV